MPTYNFAVAHLGGAAEQMTQQELREHLLELIRTHESTKEPGGGLWEPDEPARQLFDRLLPHVVGFRVRVDEARAKNKLGQNRSAANRRSTVDHLSRSTQDEHQLIAGFMADREHATEPESERL